MYMLIFTTDTVDTSDAVTVALSVLLLMHPVEFVLACKNHITECLWHIYCVNYKCGVLVVAATFICPLELIRTKMQSVQLSYREVGAAIKSSIRNNGILSMMRGLGPSLLRDIPFSGWYYLKKFYLQSFAFIVHYFLMFYLYVVYNDRSHLKK